MGSFDDDSTRRVENHLLRTDERMTARQLPMKAPNPIDTPDPRILLQLCLLRLARTWRL